MKIKINLTPLVAALFVMAVDSLLLMTCLIQLDQIVHGVMYDYGLTFSYRWAMPYWVNSGVIIGLSWFNIIAAIVLIRYIFKRRTPSKGQETRQAERMKASSEGSNEQDEKLVQLQIIDSYSELSQKIGDYDVRHPKELVDSQC